MRSIENKQNADTYWEKSKKRKHNLLNFIAYFNIRK